MLANTAIVLLVYDDCVSTESSLMTENLERIELKPQDGCALAARTVPPLAAGTTATAGRVSTVFGREAWTCRTTSTIRMMTMMATTTPRLTASPTVSDV